MLKFIINILFFLLYIAQVLGLEQDCWWAGRWAEHWATAWAEDGVTGEAGAMEEAGEVAEGGEVSNSMSQATSLSCLYTESIERQERAARSDPLALPNK